MPTEISLKNTSAVYEGLLDDMIAKYPWSEPLNLEYLKRRLRRAALHERQLLINDGYLLHAVWSREAMLDPNGLFQGLMRAGQIALLCRDEELENMPERSAKTVPSYQNLISNASWTSLKKRILQFRQEAGYRWAQWPAFDNRSGFERLAESLKGKTPDQLELSSDVLPEQLNRMLASFFELRRREPEAGARTHWETAAEESTRGFPTAKARLMHLGIEMYHYNMAALVAAKSGAEVSVSTRFSRIFTPAFLDGEEDDTPIDLQVPTLLEKLPDDLFIRVFDDQDVQSTKKRYLDAVENWPRGIGQSQLEAATVAYGEALSNAYRPLAVSATEKKWWTAGTLGVGAALAVTGTLVGTGGAVLVPAVLTGLATLWGGVQAPHMVSVWRASKLRAASAQSLTAQERQIRKATQAGQATATVRLSNDAALKHANATKIF